MPAADPHLDRDVREYMSAAALAQLQMSERLSAHTAASTGPPPRSPPSRRSWRPSSPASARAETGKRLAQVVREITLAQAGAFALLLMSATGAAGLGLLAVTRPDTFVVVIVALIDAIPGVDVPAGGVVPSPGATP